MKIAVPVENTSSNQEIKNQFAIESVGSNVNELDHTIFQQTNTIHTVQNSPVDYEELTGCEESGRKFVDAEFLDTFRNKISGFMRQGPVCLVYNSKAFCSLIGIIRFLEQIPSIFLIVSIVRGPGF